MDFKTAVSTCLTKYAEFTGRATRSEFWWFTLFATIVTQIADLIDELLPVDLFSGITFLLLIVPSLAAGARRLRDAGKSPYGLFWLLLPIVGWIILLVMLVAEPEGSKPTQGSAVQTGKRGQGLIIAGSILILAGFLIAIVPVLVAAAQAGMMATGMMWDESAGSGAALWLMFFSVPVGAVTSLIGLGLVVGGALKR